MKSFHWLFWKISYLPSFSILQSLYRKRYLTVSPFRIFLLAHALDKVENRKLQKIVPDLKELLKIGILMHRHKDGEEKARILFNLVKESQDVNALYYYAHGIIRGKYCIYNVFGEIQDSKIGGWELMESLAKKSHPKAMYLIGKSYLSKQNQEEGLKLIQKAAEKGDADACLQIGLIYRQGNDFLKAFEWIYKAHTLKKVEATFYLGSLYHQGHHDNSLIPDLEKAAKYYDEAARKGLGIAQYNLGVLHLTGLPINGELVKNEYMAIEYWKLAAENGVDLACMNLASLYTNGTADPDGLKYVNKELAFKYINKIKDTSRFVKEIGNLKGKLSTMV